MSRPFEILARRAARMGEPERRAEVAGPFRDRHRLTRLVAREAAAYLRTGLLAPSGSRAVKARTADRSDFGVLFVPGVGANASQFMALKSALEPLCDSFDAFEYSAFVDPRTSATRLRERLVSAGEASERVLAVGHSLGGLLLRLALQAEDRPPGVIGFVSICAPLHGTWRSRLALNPFLRGLAPDGALLAEAYKNAARLEALKDGILTIGSRLDSFITPYDSAFLEGYEKLCLEDTGHVGALFDPRVHQAVVELATRLKR